ncbi:creatininase family protein [Candidatus Bathyarchaeota archaeon]|nr:creatininase family protein [Candidatus Bathyarchaeota archaeon]
MKEVLLYKLTWPEIQDYLRENDVILFPTGSTEQHGKHIAEDNDAFTALEVAKRVAEKTGVLVAPVMPFGYSPHHMHFPGTITLPFEVLVQVYKEVCKSLMKHGFNKIVIMNGHGGNSNAISETLRKLKEETGMTVYSLMVFPGGWVPEITNQTIETRGGHADEMETSVGLYLGQRILFEKGEKGVQPESYSELRRKYRGKITVASDFHETTISGSIGDPTYATYEKGKKIMEAGIEEIVKFIEDLKKIS